MFQTTQCAWSSDVLLRTTSMSCMLRTKLCVPAGTLDQLIAGEVPSPGATPGAAWLNFTGIWPPSGNPAIVIVIGGAAGAAAPRCPPRSCAVADAETSQAAVTGNVSRSEVRRMRMLVLVSVESSHISWGSSDVAAAGATTAGAPGRLFVIQVTPVFLVLRADRLE